MVVVISSGNSSPTTAGAGVVGAVASAGNIDTRPRVVQAAVAERIMNFYAISESELGHVSSLNSQTTAFLAIASALLSFGVGILTNAMFADHLSDIGRLACYIMTPILIGMAIVFGLLARGARKNRQNLMEVIKRESTSDVSRQTPKP